MKRMTLSVSLLLSFMLCHAQGPGNGLIELKIGPGFPWGDFGNSQVMNEESGYAETGLSYGLSFHYRLQAHLGLVATVSRLRIPVDEEGLANKYRQLFGGYGFPTIDADPWIIHSYLAGLDIILPIYRTDFHFRLLGGMASTRLPGVSGNNHSLRREASRDLAVAWSVGGGLTYQCFRKMTLSINVDLFNTRPHLSEEWSPAGGFSKSMKESHKIAIFQLTAGLGFRIF